MAALARKKCDPTTETCELKLYYRQISSSNLLTSQQERELGLRIQAGDRSARHALAEANLRLVVKIARQFRYAPMPLSDLIQEGNLGLLEAVDKFDPQKGCRFSTYACWWIRQAIARAVANKARMIRLPVHINDLLYKYRRLNNEARANTGNDAPISLAAKTLFPVDEQNARKKAERSQKGKKLTLEDPEVGRAISRMEQKATIKLKEILRMSSAPVSLDAPIGEESDSTLKDILPGAHDPLCPQLERQELAWLLSHLTPIERQILSLRYGFDDGSIRTFNEIAAMFGISRESVRQKELRAITKLRSLAMKSHLN